tara:strand:- start:480 stop:806 length:327 start_codon:yes stop_codon:yes gene_type:complete
MYSSQLSYTSPAKAMLRMKSIATADEELKESLQVYPNPAKELLNVSLNLNAEDKGILQIMDVKGRMVQESSIVDGNNQIKLNQLSNGLYIFHIRINGKIMKTDKLMIH